jgi:hypothetical protein
MFCATTRKTISTLALPGRLLTGTFSLSHSMKSQGTASMVLNALPPTVRLNLVTML